MPCVSSFRSFSTVEVGSENCTRSLEVPRFPDVRRAECSLLCLTEHRVRRLVDPAHQMVFISRIRKQCQAVHAHVAIANGIVDGRARQRCDRDLEPAERRVPAVRRFDFAQCLQVGRGVFVIDEKAVPAVATTNCASQRRCTVSADVDRWVWILNRAWLSVDACKLNGVSGERRVRLGPECFDCVDVLVGARTYSPRRSSVPYS